MATVLRSGLIGTEPPYDESFGCASGRGIAVVTATPVADSEPIYNTYQQSITFAR